ncbi:unnamed protein product [Rotaria sp. Silwood2]|nr:unnamed protein product [Rotaria sp. Silwood2]
MLISVLLLTICGLISGQQSCDPRTFDPLNYPGRLRKFDVVGTSPLKLRAHIQLMNSTSEITFEGMVLAQQSCSPTYTMNMNTILAACRSLGCSESAGSSFTYWAQTETCEYRCPDGKKASRKCVYMVNSLECRDDAMNFAECMRSPLFQYASTAPALPSVSYECKSAGINIVCRECDEQ